MSNEPASPESLPSIPADAVPDPSSPGSMIVSASIAPIKARDLINLGAVAAVMGSDATPTESTPGAAEQSGKASATSKALSLYAPVFDVPPITRITDTSHLRVAPVTLDRAQAVALDILAAPGVDDPDWHKLRVMATAYTSDSDDEAMLGSAKCCADEIVAIMHLLPLTPMSADALSLAFATISRANERRDNGPAAR